MEIYWLHNDHEWRLEIAYPDRSHVVFGKTQDECCQRILDALGIRIYP